MTAADLILYEAEHEYFTPPGRDGGARVWNVTTILEETGVSLDFDAIERRRPGVVEFRRQLGHAVHVDCHAYDDDDLDWPTVDPRVGPFVEAWAVCRANKRLRPLSRERRVWHQGFGYCGTKDGLFLEEETGRLILGDLKIGDPDDAACHLQTAAYELAHRFEHPNVTIDARWGIQLCPEWKVPYRIREYTDFRDFGKFQACLTVFHEQPARRRRIR